ncbi:MAG: ABC transporter substrate-binding protein [Thermomicrobiales bacterium]|nr:ABC transporter substrate-binding protein [Thermomicrobiales bacterium]
MTAPRPTPGSRQESRAASRPAYAYDPEAARQALADSSYGSAEALPPIKMYYNSNDAANTARAEWVAGQYRDVLGIEIELVPTEGTALVALRKEPETFPHLLLVGGWIQDYPDAQNWLSVYFTCDATFAKRFGYCNPDFDALVKQADAERDPELRTSLYEQASELLVADIRVRSSTMVPRTFSSAQDVSGYTATALDVELAGQFTSLLELDVNRP